MGKRQKVKQEVRVENLCRNYYEEYDACMVTCGRCQKSNCPWDMYKEYKVKAKSGSVKR